MAIPVHANDYHQAAAERMTQASTLRRGDQYALAMYVAGLAVECMLRSYHDANAPFDEKHDIVGLYQACDSDRLGEVARKRLRASIQTVHLLWQNRYRFFSEDRLRAHLRKMNQHQRGVNKGADFLKVRCGELEDACLRIVTVGQELWKTN